jgi:hypothetical protein
MSDNIPVLTIDGPSGAGKGTVSRIAAARLGWHYLDSGALYRAVGVAASWANLDISDAAALVRCTFDTHVSFEDLAGGGLRVRINEVDATDELRLETTGAVASAIAAIPEVRSALKQRQRGVVRDGVNFAQPFEKNFERRYAAGIALAAARDAAPMLHPIKEAVEIGRVETPDCHLVATVFHQQLQIRRERFDGVLRFAFAQQVTLKQGDGVFEQRVWI